jgi:hypothetical protein
MEEATVFEGPESTDAFRLITLKGRLKLEALGLVSEHTPSVFPLASTLSGLKAKNAKELSPLFSAWVDDRLGLGGK